MWVTLTLDYDPYWWDEQRQGDETYPMHRQLPFREVDGYWKVSAPRAEDWGQLLVAQGEYVTLTYPEIDADYFGTLLYDIEAVYAQAADDFGLDEPPAIHVSVARDEYMYGGDLSPNTISLHLRSPRVIIHPVDSSRDDMLRMEMIDSLYREVFDFVAGLRADGQGTPAQFEYALRQWVYRQHGWTEDQNDEWMSTVTVYPEVPPPDDWDDLWSIEGLEQYQGTDRANYFWALQLLASDVLFNLLIESFGEELFVALVQHIRTSHNTQEWIEASLRSMGLEYGSGDYAEMQEQWLGRFHDEVRHVFGLSALIQP